MINFKGLFIIILAITGMLQVAQAAYISDNITMQGFGSAVYGETDTKSNTISFNGDFDKSGISKDGSFAGTKFGLNIGSKITNRIAVASQFIAKNGDAYNLTLDWAFASLTLSDWATLKLGKIKYPFGLLNEYRDIGSAYHWIAPPEFLYTDYANGASATRAAFSGYNFVFTKNFGDISTSLNAFGGALKLKTSEVRNLAGLTFNINWDDKVTLQASNYSGRMFVDGVSMMDYKKHSAVGLGLKIDWNNYLLYAETVDVTMEGLAAQSSNVNYVSVGYKIKKITPHYTLQNYKNDDGSEDMSISTAGLRYDLDRGAALKLEYSTIETNAGSGFFAGTPEQSTVLIKTGIDFLF